MYSHIHRNVSVALLMEIPLAVLGRTMLSQRARNDKDDCDNCSSSCFYKNCSTSSSYFVAVDTSECRIQCCAEEICSLSIDQKTNLPRGRNAKSCWRLRSRKKKGLRTLTQYRCCKTCKQTASIPLLLIIGILFSGQILQILTVDSQQMGHAEIYVRNDVIRKALYTIVGHKRIDINTEVGEVADSLPENRELEQGNFKSFAEAFEQGTQEFLRPTSVPLLPFDWNVTNMTNSSAPSISASPSYAPAKNSSFLSPAPTPIIDFSNSTSATSSPSSFESSNSSSSNEPTLPLSSSTMNPTISPVSVTSSPTIRTTISNSSSSPSPLPSTFSTTNAPTKHPVTSTKRPTKIPFAPPTSSPTNEETNPPTTYDVSTNMIFYNSARLKGDVLLMWKRVTSERIKKFTLMEIHLAEESSNEIAVNLEILEQDTLDNRDRLRARNLIINRDSSYSEANTSDWSPHSSDRLLLQSSTFPLYINFTTHLTFMFTNDTWDPNDMVASGFISPTHQKEYIFALKAADSINFDPIQSIVMEVDGEIVTETPEPTVEQGKENYNLYYGIAGAAGGACVCALLIGSILHCKKKNSKKSIGKMKVEKGSTFLVGSNKFETYNQPLSTSYFGTIESKEGENDDVSTLGDPYFGEAVNAVMDRDDTVAESMISAEQELFVYGVGRPRLDTGASSSRMDTTITGNSNKMIFGDDPALEDIYLTPEANLATIANNNTISYDHLKPANTERISVMAPSGKLGIVIDNPSGTIPIVHAIKESSVLHGKVLVGDLVLSVDERECQGMSAVAVSKLISSRSENPTRILVLLRTTVRGRGGIDVL